MGSKSDWDTMRHAVATLHELGVPHEVRSSPRIGAPDQSSPRRDGGWSRHRGHHRRRGRRATCPAERRKTSLPVLGVPVQSRALNGMDSLLSIAQMPAGIPVGTLAIGRAGAVNAALLATAILGSKHPQYRSAYEKYRERQTGAVLAHPDPRESE